MTNAAEANMYKPIGGEPGLVAVVDDFHGRVLSDAQLAGRGISQADFERVAFHLIGSLADAGAPAEMITKIAAAILPFAEDVVSRRR